MADPPLEVLRRVPLFEDLDRSELEHLARSFRERTFRAGDTVAAEGASGVGFFIVADGHARVSVHGAERGALGPGDYFGDVALLDDGGRTATITAETDLHCYGLTSWEFQPLVESNASIAWKLIQAMARRLRAAQERQS